MVGMEASATRQAGSLILSELYVAGVELGRKTRQATRLTRRMSTPLKVPPLPCRFPTNQPSQEHYVR